ncbi:MAG: hypothetical protein HC905_22945, partial [Bacteroidales bacterium]|nr:hypothetical protein [Bacteroidales bacterium]
MKCFLLSAILLFSLYAYSIAQNEWLSGYVLKTNQDTLFGFIENTGNKSNSFECHFRKDLSGEIQIYKPQDIIGYRYNDGKFFLSRKIVDKNGESQVFLEFLINGKIKMYHLGDETDRYFVEKDTMFYELLNTEEIVKQDYGEYLRKKKEYLGILNHLMNDGDMTNKISSLNFSAKSLIKISEEYHHKVCPNEACIVYEKNFNPVHVSWGPVLGVSLNRIKFGGMISSDYSFSNSYGLRFEFENLFHWVEKLSIVTELSMQKFSRYNISSNGKIQEYLYYNEKTYWNDFQDLKVDIETKTLKIPVIINYSFSKGSLRPYVG